MTNKEINARIRHKRDTEANWLANDPILFLGELIIVETDDGQERIKIGNGVDSYKILPFYDEKSVFMDIVGQFNGVASLNANGKVPSDQLPNYTEINIVPSDSVADVSAKQTWTSEQIYNYSDYGLILEDRINGIAAGFKAPRGMFNQLFINDFVFTRVDNTSNSALDNEIGFYIWDNHNTVIATKDSSGNITKQGQSSLIGYKKVASITKDGGLILKSSNSDKYFKITVNDNGVINTQQV